MWRRAKCATITPFRRKGVSIRSSAGRSSVVYGERTCEWSNGWTVRWQYALANTTCRWKSALWRASRNPPRHPSRPKAGGPASGAATGIRISICKNRQNSGRQSRHPAAGGERPFDRFRPHPRKEVARRQSSPYTGKPSARPAGKPGDFFIALEDLRRSLRRHPKFPPTRTTCGGRLRF